MGVNALADLEGDYNRGVVAFLGAQFEGTCVEYFRTFNTTADPPRPCEGLRKGGIALAIEQTTPWKGYFYAQWLTLHRQWHGRVDLPKEEMALVPPQHRWFAACLMLKGDLRSNDARIVRYFGPFGTSNTSLALLMSLQRCWWACVSRFLGGDVVYVEAVIIDY